MKDKQDIGTPKCKYSIVLSTFSAKEDAMECCEGLLESGAIAGANVFDPVTTMYREGSSTMSSSEVVVFMRTTDDKLELIKKLLDEFDSSIELSILNCSQISSQYLDWVVSSIH